MIHWLFLALLTGIVAAACWTDVRQRRIPNWLSALTLVTGIAYAAITYGWPQMAWALAHFGAALVVCMGLTAARIIGAGDAKFYAAMAAWLPIDRGLWLLVSVALAGLIVLIAFVAARKLRGGKVRAQSDFAKVPYGVAIGLGGLVAVALA